MQLLSNLIYGPSYVSFEFALSYYGLIPEEVTRVTSASFKKGKLYNTPLGDFVYQFVKQDAFLIGINREAIDENAYFLIASKEKAIEDLIAKIKPFKKAKVLKECLVESMRIDPKSLDELDRTLIKEIAKQYKNINVDLLWQIMKI